MTKLFMVYLGGSAENSNIEVHDVRFVAGNSIDETIPQLIHQWFGRRKNLHIDCYMEINHIDGYEVTLSSQIPKHAESLYFVNLGGYQANTFAELHEVGLFVATSPEEAKSKAKQQLLTRVDSQHKDNLLEIDDCIEVGLLEPNVYVSLSPKSGGQQIKPD